MFKQRRKSALLVDFENLFLSCGGSKFVESLDHWLRWLEDGAFDAEDVRRDFVSKEVFWVPSFERHRLEFTRRRFEIHMCRAIRKEKSSSADFDITIRAAELRHKHRDLKEIIILSMDSDFVTVLNHMQLHDLLGVGMVDPAAKFANTYRNIVDLTIEKPDFLAAFTYESPKRGLFAGPAPRAESAAVSAPSSDPPKQAASAAPKKAALSAKKPAAPQAANTPTVPFDFQAAATIVCQYAEQNGLVYLGREAVRKLVSKRPGFVVNNIPWMNAPYRTFLEGIVACDKRLSIEIVGEGGIVLSFRSEGGNSSQEVA